VRVVEEEDEDEEKYSLSLSILNFLKASSNAYYMQPYFRGKQNVQSFCKLLQYEELYSSDKIKTIPIDIENTLLGKDMHSWLEALSGMETVQPFCDVSLRALMRMADILMCRNECKFLTITQ
jgi:hypothetical protein